ncbi:MAG TPA: hypothetical protein VHG35_18895 [Gemmatimonadales bacterium]|nr:hypothetical protein [Gemmatimonadales bacterium]
MANVAATNLRPLSDSTDSVLCSQLKAVAPTPVQSRYTIADTYFRADGFYFVVRMKSATDGSILLTWTPLMIFKRQLKDWEFVEAIAM